MTATVEQTALRSLKPRAIWAFLRRQPPSFWLVLVYLFFEYVRPQTIYESLQGAPYARIVVGLALGAFVFERRKVRIGIPEIFLAFFAVIVLASSIGAFYPRVSFGAFADFYSWLVIYVLIANVIDTEDRFLIFMLCFLLYSFKMSQFGTRSWAAAGFQFREWGTTGAPGFFQNSGEFGIQMCIFLPLIVAFIQALGENWPRWGRIVAWVAAGTAVTGIVGSSSRGAVLGMATVGLYMLMKSERKMRGLVAIAVVGICAFILVPPAQKERFAAMGSDATSVSRTTYWRHGLEMMRDYPILGIGYRNWADYHGVVYGTRALPHNIFIQAGAELGYTGLLTFIALLASSFFVNRDTRRLARRRPHNGRFAFYMAHGLDGAMVGFVASGFFVTVLYYPFFWINLAMAVALNNAARNASMGQVAVVPGWRSLASAQTFAVRRRDVVEAQ